MASRGSQRSEPIWAREGFRTEYAYRTRDADTVEERRAASGHRSTADLEQTLGRKDITDVDVLPSQRPDGRYAYVDIRVEYKDGSSRTYRLRGEQATVKALDALAKRLQRRKIRVAGIEYLRKRQKAA